MGVGLHKRFPPIPYVFAMITNVLACGIMIYLRDECYMLMALYCGAPEERRLTKTRRVEKGYGRQGAKDQ